ncbi:MAG: translocation/assembly module TamB domain-containing protein [Polaromonas sp.]|uniref:translocation/assembly module TamB domain-containing protein n=1 Tax=Polaromonas sp. TaxID=1869339 RepID=UPI0027372979|nr:translocation/assembly module TamB domain-containing protein [Polaromonas sp.]MDP2820486.1 translocation/assembly module TamB domain-containing protein [Polaromonas sp.]
MATPAPSPETPAAARPRRRWPKALAASVLALLLVLLMAFGSVWWWSGTEGSLATALRWATRTQPVTAEGVSGSLRSGGQVKTLSLQQDGLQVIATEVVLAWDPLSLLKGSLKLDRLTAAQIRIDDQRAAAPRAAGPPTSLALPFRITLDGFSVGQLVWVGSPSFEASALAGTYAFDGTHHRLDLSGARVATGTYSGRVSLLATGELNLDAVLKGVLDTAMPGSSTRLPLSFNASAQGPLRELNAQAELQLSTPSPRAAATPQASATARIAPWAAQPLPQADASFRALDLASLWPAAPQTGLSGTLSVRPVATKANAWQLQTTVNNSLPGPWDQQRLPLDSLQAQGEWRDGVAMVRSLQARLGGGEITANGQWSEAAPSAPASASTQDWQAQALLKNINPAALHTQLAALPVDGRANLSGQTGAINFDASLKASGAKAAETRSSNTSPLGSLRLRDATATGRWSGDTLNLTQLQVRSDDATLTGAVELQPAARSGKGRLSLTAPGLDAQVNGELREARGGGELSLRGRDAGQALRWLQRLPGMPAAARTASASGRADLQLAWQGGWRDPVVQAQLDVPSLDWMAAPPARSGTAAAPAQPLKLRAVQASLSGRLSQADLKAQGRIEQGQRRYSLQTTASGGRIGLAKASLVASGWQAVLQQLNLSVEDPALGAGAWRLASRRPVPLKWTPTSKGGALETGAGQAVLSAPVRDASGATARAPSQAVLAWQPIKYGGGQLLTAGTLTGLPLAWIELLAGPQLTGAGLAGNLLFDGRWDAALGGTLRLKASLARSSGDISVQADTAQGPATRVAAGVKEARLTLDSNGETLTMALRWDSERAGTAEGQLATRLVRSAATDWAWPEDAPLNGQLRAQLPRIGVWSVLAPPGWRLRGSLGANVAISGNRAAPQLAGTLQADDLALRSVVDGIEFGNGRLRATLDGTRMRISEFILQGAGDKGAGGVLRAQGEAGWVDGKPQVLLNAKLERLRTDRQITLSGDIQARLEGKAAAFNGALRVDQASILLPDESTPQLGDDVIVRGSSGGAAAGKKAPAETSSTTSANEKNDRSLKLTVQLDLGDNLRIQGKGLDTRVRGTLALNAEAIDAVRLTGTVSTVGGQYRAYGQRLDVEQGLLRFTGAVDNPTLDILAIRPNLTQRVGVQITGTALLPRVRLYAQPELPDAEKLSWLVVGRASASGGAEAALLQQAAIALLGSKTGQSAGLAASLGLDELSFRGSETLANGSTSQGAVTLGKRFSRNFYAAYERSLSGALGTLFVFYDLSQRFTIRAQAGEQSAVDLIYTLPFD